MATVRKFMTPGPITVSPGTSVVEAANLLSEHHLNGLQVVDKDSMLVGILAEGKL